MIRLLKLPEKIRNDLVDDVLSMGHARALLALPDSAVQLQARNTIVKRSLSVRDAEERTVRDAEEGLRQDPRNRCRLDHSGAVVDSEFRECL